jgi:hypothetical protein
MIVNSIKKDKAIEKRIKLVMIMRLSLIQKTVQ